MPGHTKCCTCHAKSSQQTYRSDAPKCNPSQEMSALIATKPSRLLTVDKIDNPLHLPRGTTAQLPKVVQTPSVFNILTSKCASRHNGVHFFDISTSKSGPNVVCFVHFDLEMCFAPQRRALFDIATSKSEMAPHPPLQRAYFSTLRSHKSLGKHSVSRLSYLFAHLHLLSSDSFSSLIFFLLIFLFSLPLPCSAFHLSILSEV